MNNRVSNEKLWESGGGRENRPPPFCSVRFCAFQHGLDPPFLGTGSDELTFQLIAFRCSGGQALKFIFQALHFLHYMVQFPG